MQKPLPPATFSALSPPANAAFPYTFFVDAAIAPFQPADHRFNLRNASWLMDAAFLAYSAETVIRSEWFGVSAAIEVRYFAGANTECYVAAAPDWIVLAWRGTQVDAFWASMLDWLTDARFAPVRDSDGNLVHSGFLDATGQVWSDVRAHIAGLQQQSRRPLWITGHSLGAALATVAANRCSHDPALGHVGTYTYGSPRVGDPRFGQQISTPTFRVQNNTDLVAHLPLGLIYEHVGASEFIDAGGHLHGGVMQPDWLMPFDPDLVGELPHRRRQNQRAARGARLPRRPRADQLRDAGVEPVRPLTNIGTASRALSRTRRESGIGIDVENRKREGLEREVSELERDRLAGRQGFEPR